MTIQSDVYVIILITTVLAIAMILLSKKINKADPLEKPKGIVVPIVLATEAVYKTVRTNVGKKVADKLTPYILALWFYIFVSNTISLFGLSSPTANFSVTITLSFLTWLMIQVAELKYGGFKAYMHAFLEPIAPMLPMNIIGKFSTMLSMALRLFGNITCGSIMMSLVYMGTANLSNALAGLVGIQGTVFNFMAPIIAPALHMYFDLFAGFIQTLVFVTLTIVLLGNDIPEEEKN